MPSPPSLEPHYSYRRASELLGVPAPTLRRWCNEGKIRRVKTGADPRCRVLIPESALNEFLTRHTLPTRDELIARLRSA